MIIWFSGTGNSQYVAEKYAEISGDKMIVAIPSIVEEGIAVTDSDKAVVWVFPVYSWGVPPYVRDAIRKMHVDGFDRLTHHLILTCGDDCGMAPEMWRKELKRRGWTTGNSYTVIQPNNYVAMKGFDVDSSEVATKKLAATEHRVREIAAELEGYDSARNGNKNDVVRGSFPRLKTGIVYPWFVRFAMSVKPFHATDSCISCGKCERICPLGNIELVDTTDSGRKRPQWHDHCAGCLACYHVCPVHAVEYGDKTLHKGQYLNPFVDRSKR